MTHPARYSADDPYLARLREICLALPQALEKVSHGSPNFYTRKVFAVFGGVVKGNHSATVWSQSVLVLPDAAERTALLLDERFFDPAYLGPSGWVGLNFRAFGADETRVDWDEVRELVDASYRNTAPKRLVAELDAG
ncbi:MmcQ/YjbR family DNA-binding protein [Nakamurella lactea]|uniref:MmcQ/YjbR family DNA-binding protein n=1 Tax=Nakamurella lactea TaxID=459515 RepID=UPI00040D39B4|nr:MmcQ/YjbR family DNA-binding protein [Nakamurella lactea]